MKQSHQVFIVFIVLGNLVLYRFDALFDYVVILLTILEDKVRLLGFIVTTNHPSRQQIAEGVFILEALSNELEAKAYFFVLCLCIFFRADPLLE